MTVTTQIIFEPYSFPQGVSFVVFSNMVNTSIKNEENVRSWFSEDEDEDTSQGESTVIDFTPMEDVQTEQGLKTLEKDLITNIPSISRQFREKYRIIEEKKSKRKVQVIKGTIPEGVLPDSKPAFYWERVKKLNRKNKKPKAEAQRHPLFTKRERELEKNMKKVNPRAIPEFVPLSELVTSRDSETVHIKGLKDDIIIKKVDSSMDHLLDVGIAINKKRVLS